MKKVTLDASVLLAAATPHEVNHQEASEFLVYARASQAWFSVTEPLILMFEHFASYLRSPGGRDAKLVGDFAVTFVSLSEGDVMNFIDAHRQWLPGQAPFTKRGGDLAYLCVAWKAKTTLLTFDVGLLKYNGVFGEVVRPAEFVASTEAVRAVSRCPSCHADGARPIQYGEPAGDAVEAASRGELVNRGCCIELDDDGCAVNPAWQCKECGNEFGRVKEGEC